MLQLPDHWIWDSWPVDDGAEHHLFYLKAPKHLKDPDLRHHNTTIGHAVSTDYASWRMDGAFVGAIPLPSPSGSAPRVSWSP